MYIHQPRHNHIITHIFNRAIILNIVHWQNIQDLCNRIAMLKSGKVVALARTSELLKAASSHVLRMKIEGELPPALAERARVTGRVVQFPAHDAREIESYLAAVRESGVTVDDVEITKADLEDVFLEVMGTQQ